MTTPHHDITQYGAVGDGATLNTDAIQRAVDAAGKAGGGTVLVPPGTYLTGTVFLRSGVTLDLHPAARILGSPRLEDYREKSWGQHIDRTPWHLLVADGIRDVKITGGGTIDGNGPAFWEPCVAGAPSAATEPPPPGAFGSLDAIHVTPARHADPQRAPIAWIRANKEKRPSPMIEVTGCENVRVEDVRIVNSAGWVLHLHNSNFIWIRGVRLTTNLMGPNNDGFDITGCHDVMISDCHLSCCDDAICLKTTPDSQTCERIAVTNCIIRTKCVALKLGCAESFHDFRQITFSNCVVYESSRAVGFYTKRGGNMEDVAISNIVCDTRNPFVMNRPIQLMAQTPPDGVAPGRIRNVVISNVVCRTDGRILLTADEPGQIDNVVLRDIHIVYPTVDDPALLVKDITCGQFPCQHPDAAGARAVVVAKNLERLVVDNLTVTWPQAAADGTVACPEDWRFPVKACNGMFDTFFPRKAFNTERIPDFHVVWAKTVRGGRIHTPLADPPRAGIERGRFEDCDLSS